MNELIAFLTNLFVKYPEGMFLYTGGTFTIIGLNVYYQKDWDLGAKGANHLWDLPEVLSVLFGRWLIPQMVLSSYCLPQVVIVPEYAWWVVSAILFFALTGRWGLEWLGTMKGTTKITKRETNETTRMEESKTSNSSTSDSDSH